VALYGGRRNEKLAGDLGVTQVLAHERNHPALSPGEALPARAGTAVAASSSAGISDSLFEGEPTALRQGLLERLLSEGCLGG
jgi:hypothetical protein